MDFIDLKTQYRALKSEIDDRIHRVLDHGQFILGPEVHELEVELARFVGARHCISVASGTEALLIALMAKGIGPGDEVITTPFTFVATAEVIVLVGAKPVFVDIEPDTCNIDASQIESRITPKTKAIMPVSLYGQCANMDEINSIAGRHGLSVIEDAAQSLGASYKGRRSGHLSEIGCTSFFPSKPLGCYGDGGAIFVDEDSLAQACREIRVHGQSARYHHTRVGVGGRMDTLQCAVLLAKLGRFQWEIDRRQELGRAYRAAITAERLPVRFVSVRPDRDSVWAQYTVFVNDRDLVQARMLEAGVPTAVHYPKPLHLQPAYSKYCCAECCPNSLAAGSAVLSLPFSADLNDHDLRKVVQALAHATRGR